MGNYVESIITRGLDFWKPYKSASNSWRIDIKLGSLIFVMVLRIYTLCIFFDYIVFIPFVW